MIKRLNYTNNIFYYIFIMLIIIYILYFLYEPNDNKYKSRTIEKDGYKIFNNVDVNDVVKYLPKGYVVIDYKYQIKGCSLSTFHRDVTSSRYVYKTQYPVYTYIVYYNEGALLSVAPNSHKSTPFLWNRCHIINGTKNTGVLFDCDIVHSGAINTFGDKRHAIQYKICHYKDMNKLSHLIKINKTTNGNCNISPIYQYFCRKLSLTFPFVFNHLFTSLLQEKPQDDSVFNYIIRNFYIGDFYNK